MSPSNESGTRGLTFEDAAEAADSVLLLFQEVWHVGTFQNGGQGLGCPGVRCPYNRDCSMWMGDKW